MPQYLEMSMTQFARNQEQMRRYLQNAFGFNPFQQFEAMGKQNMAMFENAMRMFNPFAAGQGGRMPPGRPPTVRPSRRRRDAQARRRRRRSDAAIEDLKRKLDELQNQLAELSKKS